MKSRFAILSCFAALTLQAQEAQSGFEVRATLSGLAAGSGLLTENPRAGAPVDAGFRAVLYPVWKLDQHWAISGAYQVVSRPYFFESFSTQGHGVKGSILQATLNYSRTARNRSLLVRVGEMSTAFGSFLLHYDDADNALIDLPRQYGYYYASISSFPVAGAQLDVTEGKWDGRLQFANSSPANPRSIFARDQYGNWAGGGGYTILQGLRVGASAYRGPYLDRHFRFFFPGEANPSSLPASALGLDVQWARGHWNFQGELQKFTLPYKVIPTFRQQAGFVEAKRVLHPRLYVAARFGYLSAAVTGNTQTLEMTAGVRPGPAQLLKLSYELEHATQGPYRDESTVAIQWVTTLRPFSHAWK